MTDDKASKNTQVTVGAIMPASLSVSDNVGAISAAAREDAEIKAAIVVAKGMPRSEEAARIALIKACRRPGFAKKSTYTFPRGGKTVSGPSIHLAREAARCWGNIRYGMRIVSKDEDYNHVVGWALDLETNTFSATEDKFRRLVQRRDRDDHVTRWVVPDERDERELTNRRGAICVRNAILQILPPDIIEDALAEARATTLADTKNAMKDDPARARRALVEEFDKLGVTVQMIEGYLKHPVNIITDEEVVDLRQVWTSLRDGNTGREDHFPIPRDASSARAATLDALVAAAKEKP